jgi:outer membrane protein assembly factor BamB
MCRKDGFLTVMAMALTVLPLLTGAVQASDWPMFQQNPQHTGDTDSSTPDHPKVLWEKHLNDKGFYSTPTIVKGKIFLGGLDRKMYALDAQTGDTYWTYSTTPSQNGHGIDDTAAVSAGKVYFGADDFYFYCLDANNGDLVWNYNLASQTGINPQTYGFQSSPLIANGVVYAGADMSQADNLNLVDNLQAFDAATGAVLWTFDTNGRVYPSPTLSGNRLFVGTFTGDLFVVDISTAGTHKNPTATWQKHYDEGLMGSPMVFEDHVYVGTGQYQESEGTYYLYSYDMSGHEVWKFKTAWPILSTPIPHEGVLYFADYGGTVHAVNIQGNGGSTTDTVWTHFLSDERVWATTLLADGKLFITSEDGRLYALDPKGNGDGTTFELWNLTLDGPIWSSPVAVDDKLYVATTNGTLYCIIEDPTPNQPVDPVLDSVSVEPQESKAGQDITITLRFRPGDDLTQVSEVFVDLTQLGGPSKAVLYDNGSSGDQTAKDGIYTKVYNLAKITPQGYYELEPTATLKGGKKLSDTVRIYVGAADTGGDSGGGSPGPEPTLMVVAIVIAALVVRRGKQAKY